MRNKLKHELSSRINGFAFLILIYVDLKIKKIKRNNALLISTGYTTFTNVANNLGVKVLF